MRAFGWAWGAVAALVALAIVAGIADWRGRRRTAFDRVSIVYWPTVQVLALIAAAMIAFIVLAR